MNITSDHPYQSLLDEDVNAFGNQHQDEVGGLHHRNLSLDKSLEGGLPESSLTEGLLSGDHDARSSASSASSASSSSSSSSDWSHADNMDVRYSMICNGLFFLGSALQTVNAIWDIKDLAAVGEDDDDNDAASGDDDDAASGDDDDINDDDAWNAHDYAYFYTGAAGVFLFILNAAVELAWVRASRKYRPGQGRFGEDSDDPNLWSALSFGAAAVLEFVSIVTWTDDIPSPLIAHVNMASMHIYFLSGALALKGKGLSFSFCRISPLRLCRDESSTAIARVLMELGGVLFLMGCTVDVVMSWLYDPEVSNMSAVSLAWGNLVSALLWLIDSICYLISECISYRLYRRSVGLFVRWVRSRAELPRVIVQRDEDAAAGKLHV
eukprot:CAMPEP_0178630722 /NCGR_PEP_ID=MMETSP0698-20121128/10636_1 /TAXON_ID=265572 /ORGANISM="Extubocellulus spinifer, Strain CCMP396" /LENGTH=379 /DNA_ID=CAMNT_0020270117 /DNA_START=116 /DNA_END=1255 /DNA_ORIENTATION=+